MTKILDSKSQNNQDNFVLSELGYKNNGFYVEFGACDGVMLSNSFSLENEYAWSGILAEPAKSFKEALINEIIRIDNDNELYNSIISQPKFKHNIVPSCMNYNNFLNWFDAVVYNRLHMRT